VGASPGVPGVEDQLARAVRNSLNLPRLRMDARRSGALKCWQVRLRRGVRASDWISLDAQTAAVMTKLGLVPPRHLGTFRLAYDSIKSGVGSS